MSSSPLRLVIVEDNPSDVRLVLHELRQAGFEPDAIRVDNPTDFQAALSTNPDVILCDYNLPQFSAPHALELLQESGRDTPFLIVSGSIGEETAVEAMKRGVTDYLLKDRLGRLGPAIQQAIAQRKLREAENRAREELQKSEEQLRAFFDTTNAAMAVVDREGRHLRANDSYTHMAGFSRRELLESRFVDHIHEGDLADAEGSFHRLISGEADELQTEWRYLRANGETGFAEVNLVRIESGTGLPPRVAIVALDISERKRSEAAILEREHLLRNIIANIPCGVFWKDRNSVYIGCNDRFAQYCGHESALTALGATAQSVFASRVEADVSEADDRRVIESGELILNREEIRTRADGTQIQILTSKVPLRDARGEIVGVLGVNQDITERKKLEEQYRQSQKMEAIGQLAGGIAHDFNNLLTVINGYSGMLLTQTERLDDATRSSLLEIHQAGERAASLTAQLLAFSRKTIVAPRVMNLNEVIAEITKLLGRLLGDDIRLNTALQSNLRSIRADRGQVEQVILNLVVNARDAMPKGGRLTLETANVEITEGGAFYPDCPPGRYVRLAVSDTGTGMTNEVKAKIFEPFFTTKPPGKGTGLGLATVYGIVKQAGGHISAYTEVGVGTTFKVLLPAMIGSEDRSEEAPAPALKKGSETLLLVEDEESVRRYARVALESLGYTVIEAANGLQALDRAAMFDGPIHMLLTDVVMPEMGGRDLVERLRLQRPELHVLYMSGYTDDVIVRHGVIEESDAFLQKPFTPIDLARRVRVLLDNAKP
jgi:two-component system, cell cycle sensor histidine kinase and response regulator CckA